MLMTHWLVYLPSCVALVEVSFALGVIIFEDVAFSATFNRGVEIIVELRDAIPSTMMFFSLQLRSAE